MNFHKTDKIMWEEIEDNGVTLIRVPSVLSCEGCWFNDCDMICPRSLHCVQGMYPMIYVPALVDDEEITDDRL